MRDHMVRLSYLHGFNDAKSSYRDAVSSAITAAVLFAFAHQQAFVYACAWAVAAVAIGDVWIAREHKNLANQAQDALFKITTGEIEGGK